MKRSASLVIALALLTTLRVSDVADAQAVASWRDPSPHILQSVTVESSVRLEVLDWGGSGPSLVLLGCYLTAHAYDLIAPKLTNEFHVYGITRRGIGASDRPTTGYAVERSADDVVEVLDALNAKKTVLVGHSCAGQILTLFASRHSERLSGLVYLDGAGDPTTPAHDPPMPDLATLPRPRSRGPRVTFPEAEQRAAPFTPEVRRAITVDARIKPDYTGIRVPVLAIYQAQLPFEEMAEEFDIRNEEEGAALRQEYAATRAMYTRWQQELLAAVPAARILELAGANLYMFLSNEVDIIRELRAFASSL